MSWLCTVPLWLVLLGGDHERGLQLYREGKYPEAVQAFEAAIRSDGDSPELQWNLALAHFAAGTFDKAETAAEKYAALAPGARADLHLGMLGAVRLQQARTRAAQALAAGQEGASADPLPELEKALATAKEAVDYYERALVEMPAPELRQGLERAQRFAQALAERIEERKKQQKPSDEKKPDQDGKQPEDKEPDEKKPDEKKSGDGDPDKDEKKPDDQKGEGDSSKPDQSGDDPNAEKKEGQAENGEAGEGEQKPSGENRPPEGEAGEPAEPQGNGAEPKPGDAKPDNGASKEAEPGAGQPEEGKEPDKPGSEAPKTGRASGQGSAEGEGKPRELSEEQLLRLQETLRKLEEQARQIQGRTRSGRRPVERDW